MRTAFRNALTMEQEPEILRGDSDQTWVAGFER
jgi:hypothetical protein